MRSDIDPRRANQQGASKEAERPLWHAMKQEARRDGERRGGVIGGERPVAAAADDQVTYTGIVRTNPMHIEKNDLVESKSDDEGESCGDACMSDMNSLSRAPPLQRDEQHKERNDQLGCRYHERVQQDVAAGQRIDPLIHRVIA